MKISIGPWVNETTDFSTDNRSNAYTGAEESQKCNAFWLFTEYLTVRKAEANTI